MNLKSILSELSKKYNLRPDMAYFLDYMDDQMLKEIIKKIRSEINTLSLDQLNLSYGTNLSLYQFEQLKLESEEKFHSLF